MFFGVSIITQRSNTVGAVDESLQMYKALNMFYEIDDIAHQENNRIMKSGNPDLMTGETVFLQLDSNFHSVPSTNVNEKFKAAKKLETFLKQQDVLLHKL